MKKLIALTLVLASVFALCAIGGAAPAAEAAPAVHLVDAATEEPVLPEEYQQFEEVFEALVAGEYDKAQALIEKMKPQPDIVEIEITKDNFLDYFEYTSDFKPARHLEKNSKGKTVGFYLQPAYALKDGYKVAIDEEHQSKVEVGVKYKVKFYYPVKKNVDVDFDKLTYKVTGKARQTDNIDEQREGWITFNEEDNSYSFYIPLNYSTYMTYKKDYWASAVPKKDVQFVSAKGTLYLYADSIPESAPESVPEAAPAT